MLRSLLALAPLALFIQNSSAAPKKDLINDLPGLTFKPDFKQYSGYLQGDKPKHLHYWFVESSGSSEKDPLVVWFNGGPGASSLIGLMAENGPFRVKSDGKTLVRNPSSWNTVANVIYLEAPAGVGYSYSDDGNYQTGDNETAHNNYLAIKDFFKKFPEYANNDFYLTGESYGGMYIPVLTMLLLKDSDINLKGFAIGNALSDWNQNKNSAFYFQNYHGLAHKSDWRRLLHECCPENNTLQCNIVANQSKSCDEAQIAFNDVVFWAHLNPYNIYDDSPSLQYRTTGKNRLFQTREDLTFHPPQLYGNDFTTYLNLPEVRKALHIPDNLPEWDDVSGRITFKTEYKTMKPQYLEAIKRKLRIMVYNGDVDMVCNFIGDEWFVDSLHDTNPKKYGSWFYNKENKQINGGFFKTYDHVTFVTIRGSGHLVPMDKPEAALQMFTNYIQNKPF